MDPHQRIQLTEITTTSLRSGSPVRHQLNFTLLMEGTSCSLALSSEFVDSNKKKELTNNSGFFCVYVFYCFYKSMRQCWRVTICYNFHCLLDFFANTCRVCTLEWWRNNLLCIHFNYYLSSEFLSSNVSLLVSHRRHMSLPSHTSVISYKTCLNYMD